MYNYEDPFMICKCYKYHETESLSVEAILIWRALIKPLKLLIWLRISIRVLTKASGWVYLKEVKEARAILLLL